MMKTCIYCNYTENPSDAIFCVKCRKAMPIVAHALIEAARPVGATGALTPPVIESDSKMKRPSGLDEAIRSDIDVPVRNRHEGKLGRYDIAVYVGDWEEPLLVSVVRDTIIGRYGGEFADQQAHIDLATYGALDRGVSRQHALLRRFGPDIGIVDLESRNGTWLNGVRLQPRQSFMLRNGDRLLLSHLPIYIFVPPPYIPTGKTGTLPQL